MRYWHQQGRHQKVYARLREKLVPDEGEAATEAGEIVRRIGNVVYEVGNNGGCNFDCGRQEDLEAFIGYLRKYQFNDTGKLHEQLAGLAVNTPQAHCETCDCVDDFKQYPPLDEKLFDEAIDLLIVKADRLDKRKIGKNNNE